MLIPMRRLRVDAAGAVSPDADSAPADIGALVRRFEWLGRCAAAGLRGLVSLFAALLLVRDNAGADGLILLTAGMVAAGVLVAGWMRALPQWAALIGDGAAIGMLLYVTGGAASPLLALALLLVFLGGLTGGARDALAGAGIGVVLLLLLALAGGADDTSLIMMVIAEIIVGGAAAWAWSQGSALHAALREHLRRADAAAADRNDTRRAIEWQRATPALLQQADSLADLAQRAAQRAAQIAGAPATVAMPGDATPDMPPLRRTLRLAIDTTFGAGSLIVECAAADLTAGQTLALEHLADLTGRHASALRSDNLLQRQQEALTTLWQVAGVVRRAPDGAAAARDVCTRMAGALKLDWLALLTPDACNALAPILLVRGKAGAGAPRLQGAQLRVAAEALRAGRPLVRSEGDAVVFCLPLQTCADTPLLLVARGDAGEAGIQALLMIFGGMLAERLTA
jgi:hypothetical protein